MSFNHRWRQEYVFCSSLFKKKLKRIKIEKIINCGLNNMGAETSQLFQYKMKKKMSLKIKSCIILLSRKKSPIFFFNSLMCLNFYFIFFWNSSSFFFFFYNLSLFLSQIYFKSLHCSSFLSYHFSLTAFICPLYFFLYNVGLLSFFPLSDLNFSFFYIDNYIIIGSLFLIMYFFEFLSLASHFSFYCSFLQSSFNFPSTIHS